MESPRRNFLKSATATLIGTTAYPLFAQEKDDDKDKDKNEIEVTTNEDLMREHGVLRRILLIYDHVSERALAGKIDFNPRVVEHAADIVHRFVEDYHEKLEQDHIFPRLKKAGKLTELVEVLLEQHQVGRTLTQQISASASGLKNKETAHKMAEAMRKFNHMYRPHAAREDTVLFPALKTVVSQHEYDAMGEQFEDIEKKSFGEDGFEAMLSRVEGIEKELGLYDLAQFTPKV